MKRTLIILSMVLAPHSAFGAPGADLPTTLDELRSAVSTQEVTAILTLVHSKIEFILTHEIESDVLLNMLDRSAELDPAAYALIQENRAISEENTQQISHLIALCTEFETSGSITPPETEVLTQLERGLVQELSAPLLPSYSSEVIRIGLLGFREHLLSDLEGALNSAPELETSSVLFELRSLLETLADPYVGVTRLQEAGEVSLLNEVEQATPFKTRLRNLRFARSNPLMDLMELPLPESLLSGPRTIRPSTGSDGNITGNEFPSDVWAVTFDDGPSGSGSTQSILDNIAERGVQATFFMLAQMLISNYDMAKSIRDAGMEVASHSYTHAQLTRLTGNDAKLEHEITGAKKVISDKLGLQKLNRPITLMRLPYGAGVTTPVIRQKIADNDMVHVFWNVDTLDWKDRNSQSIFARAKGQIVAHSRTGGVILFHDIHQRTVEASRLVMDYLISKGKRLCTVQSAIDEANGGALCNSHPLP